MPRITKTVPRNVYPPPRKESTSISIAPSSDVRVRAPLTRIDSSVWQNSSQEICPPVPRNNVTDSDISTAPPPPKRKRNRVQRRERRAREREERARIDEAFNHDARWTIQNSGAPSSTNVPDPLTTIGLPHSEPISAMRPAVYPPVTEQGRPVANHNSNLHFRQELGELVGLHSGLYKAPYPDSPASLQELILGVQLRRRSSFSYQNFLGVQLRSQAKDRNSLPTPTTPTTS